MNITKSNTLSFYNEQGILTLHAKQFDTGRRFVFHIIDNDEPFDLSDCNAYLRIAKADGTQFESEECCSISGNTIIIDTSISNGEQILTASGLNKCEIHLMDDNNKSLTTWDFNIEVKPRVHDGSHIDSIDSWDAWDKMKNDVYNLKVNFNKKANIDSPTLTGIPKAPTASVNTNTEQIATTAFVQTAFDNSKNYADTKIADLIDGAPETLDTLKEVADAIRDNEDIITTLNEAITKKLDKIGDASNVTTKTKGAGNESSPVPIIGNGRILPSFSFGNATPKLYECFWAITVAFAALSKVASSGSYNDLSNKPTIPTKTSELTNDSGYITNAGVTKVNGKTGDANLTAEDVEALSASGGTITGSLEVKKTVTAKDANVNGSFIVNKKSTTKPTGRAEVVINSDGKISLFAGSEGATTEINNTGITLDWANQRIRNNIRDVELDPSSDAYRFFFGGLTSTGKKYAMNIDKSCIITREATGLNGHGDSKSVFAIGERENINIYNTKLDPSTGNPTIRGGSILLTDDSVEISGTNGNNIIEARGNSDYNSSIKLRAGQHGRTQFEMGMDGHIFFKLSNDLQNDNTYFAIENFGIPSIIGEYEDIDFDNIIFKVYGNGMLEIGGAAYDYDGDYYYRTGKTRLTDSSFEILNYSNGTLIPITRYFQSSINVSGKIFRIVLDSLNSQKYIGFEYISNNLNVYPYVGGASNTTKSLGTSTNKWTNIYATNGTIQTSDRNEKNAIKELTDEKAQQLIYGLKPSTYQMNEGTSGRTHWGMISQDIEELLEELGWTSLDFAGFIKSPKMTEAEYDEKNGECIKEPGVIEGEYNYSLRYDEFIAPLIKTVQAQHEEIRTLKQEMSLLKQQMSDLLNMEK